MSPINWPLDLDPKWMNVIRRIQSVASINNKSSYAILTIHVLVNDQNDPVLWTRPSIRLIEPHKRASELFRIIAEVTNGTIDDDESDTKNDD